MSTTRVSGDGHNRRERPARVRIEDDDPAAVMLQLTEGDFYNLVDKDVRGGLGSALSLKLRDPAVVERWYQTLLRMKRTVEGTIAAKASEERAMQIELRLARRIDEADTARAEFLRWRAGSIRFKVGVEEKMTEASWRRRLAVDNFLYSAAAEERGIYAERLRTLEQAIARHRREIDPEDVTEIDEELWRSAAGPPASDYFLGSRSVDGY